VQPSPDFDTVLVVDFGAQYAQLIARRVRECQVYSEIVPATMPAAEMLARKPKAIILSGGPASVYSDGAPPLPSGPPELLGAGVPVLGICYGFQLMVTALGGTVSHNGSGEYGATRLILAPTSAAETRKVVEAETAQPGGLLPDEPWTAEPLPHEHLLGGALLDGLPETQQVWMSHGDTATAAPAGFTVTAGTAISPVAAMEDTGRGLYGVQFHPEVMHTEHGQAMLRRFLELAGCRTDWTMGSIIDEQVERVRAQVGEHGAICGLSGGVDSAVAAAIVQKAIGSQLTCVFVDHGLLRRGEADQVEKDFVAATGVDLKVVDAAATFLAALAGGEAQDHRPGVHPGLRARRPGDQRGGGQSRDGRGLPGPGHPVPGRGRVRRRHRRGQHQVPSQRRRPAQRPGVRAGRAVAGAVQGRGAAGR
jgi:GMP synthase (glutamine-hydrolysing)